MKKLFGEINLTWKKVIISAVLVAIYTAIVALLPVTKDTSFRDIAISFEWWILFGIIIIMNSKSNKDASLKCFIFFLISQPLIYLIQVPFLRLGWQLFGYYKYWFIWTLFTIVMGYIGYYLKKDKWWGLFILSPILIFLAYHFYGFLSETLSFFPNHLLSTLFCFITLIIYPLYIFKNKKIRLAGLIISILLVIISIIIVVTHGTSTYNTTILVSSGASDTIFNETYEVYLKDKKYGDVFIVYDENIADYMVNASFKKTGKTELILKSPDGEITTFELDIQRTSYDIIKK